MLYYARVLITSNLWSIGRQTHGWRHHQTVLLLYCLEQTYTILLWVCPVTDHRLRQNVAQLSHQNGIASLSYKANMSHVVVRLFSNRSHMAPKCDKNKFWISCGNIESIYWIETRLSIKNSVKQQRKNTVQQTSNANVCATIMLRNNQYINYRVNCMLDDLLIG